MCVNIYIYIHTYIYIYVGILDIISKIYTYILYIYLPTYMPLYLKEEGVLLILINPVQFPLHEPYFDLTPIKIMHTKIIY